MKKCSFLVSAFLPSGSESVGSTNMCKTDEAKGSHRQRQVIAAKSGWHSGELTCVKYAVLAAVQQIQHLNLLSFYTVSVRQF